MDQLDSPNDKGFEDIAGAAAGHASGAREEAGGMPREEGGGALRMEVASVSREVAGGASRTEAGDAVIEEDFGVFRNFGNLLMQAISNTSICMFLYYPQEKRIEVPKRTCEMYGCASEYCNMPDSFADDFVHDADREAFCELYYKIDAGAKTASALFHSKDMEYCNRVTLTELDRGIQRESGLREVIGIIEDLSDWDKNRHLIGAIEDKLGGIGIDDIDAIRTRGMVASAIGERYDGLYCIDLRDGTFTCNIERNPATAALTGRFGDCAVAIEAYMESFVDESDREAFRAFTDLSDLKHVLRDRNTVSCEYRRKDAGWMRAQVIVAKRDENGDPVDAVFAVSDINSEKSLEAARRKALYESTHDALTGAFNRKAFDSAMLSQAFSGRPVGFAIIDVDRFKEINDGFGHEMGDAVLAATAETITSVFREGDLLYRVGGDEFVVLLPNATPDSWKAICAKLERAHATLPNAIEADIDLTLSAGVCFSPSGVGEWMYPIADKALFNTKRNGRAGCTLIGENGSVLAMWRDSEASSRPVSSLEGVRTGTVRIEIPTDRRTRPRLFCSDGLRRVYGMPSDMTPEECFSFWVGGIDPSYHDIVWEAVEEALSGSNIECSFLWSRGEDEAFMVRAVWSGFHEEGFGVISGMHRSLEGSKVIEKKDDSDLIIAAQNGVYVSVYYIDIEADAIDPLKQTDRAAGVFEAGCGAQEMLGFFVVNLIDAAYGPKVSGFFDLSTLPERMGAENSIDCDFLSTTAEGWCRASWLPVKRGEDGRVTHALFVVASLDAACEAEIANDRMTAELMGLHYEAAESILDSKILAMALFDRKTGKGRSWSCATGFSKPREVDYDELRARDASILPRDRRKEANASLELAHVVDVLCEHGAYSVPLVYERPSGSPRYLIYHFSQYSHDKSLIMTVVEDATKKMEAERDFARTRGSLEAALASGDLMVLEYDPAERTAVFLTDENPLGFPKRIESYPESLMGHAEFEPDDADTFLATVRQIDEGAESAQCDVRMYIDGMEHWVSCSFHARRDPVLGRRLATLFVMDITLRVAAVRDFEERMESLLYADESVLRAGVYNLSKDSVVEVRSKDRILPGMASEYGLDETIATAALGIPYEEERRRYLDMFSRDGLLLLAESGAKRASMECLYRAEPGRTEWAEASAELVTNPINGDIEVIGRIRSISDQRVPGMLVRESIRGSVNSSSILMDWGDEYYLYDSVTEAECRHRQDYWGDLAKVLESICEVEEQDAVLALLDREQVIRKLVESGEAKASFSAGFAGESLRMELAFSVVDASKGIVFACIRDITDEEVLEKLRHDSRHDALTGLYNRQALFAKCGDLLASHPDQDFVMAKVNVRRFRMYNSFFGEKAGDELLKTIANNLREIAGDYPFSAYGRIESDVFCGFYPKDDDMLARHIELVKERFAAYRDDFRLEPSIGVYVVSDRGLPIEGMFARASSAAKEGGTRICEFAWRYNEQLEQKLRNETLISNEMQWALDQEQFQVYLQPKYDLQTGERSGAEALVRWIHPTRGMVSPGVFIPVFEGNGFILALDQYMWEHVCALLRKWIDQGQDPKPVSVNVSRVSAYSPTTVPFLLDLVRRYGIEPSLLELELTESAYIDEPEEIRCRMRMLQDAGFKILMDDFGSGYSSLNTLRNLPVDALKLDIGFIAGAEDVERGRTVVSSILNMTKKLELPVIAEGVETERQASFLREAGCEHAQGYLFARPMPVADYELLE